MKLSKATLKVALENDLARQFLFLKIRTKNLRRGSYGLGKEGSFGKGVFSSQWRET